MNKKCLLKKKKKHFCVVNRSNLLSMYDWLRSNILYGLGKTHRFQSSQKIQKKEIFWIEDKKSSFTYDSMNVMT